MKNLFAFAIGIVFCFPFVAKADTISFNYAYSGSDGITATEMLTGVSVGDGEYHVTSGSINVQGNTPLSGAGTFVQNSGSGVFQTGGGTELLLSGTNSNLFFPASQYINNTGLFLFQMNSGLGLGLFSNEPTGPGYGIFGGNWQLVDCGNLSVSMTPEPASLLLLGTGFGLVATVLFLKRKRTANAHGMIV